MFRIETEKIIQDFYKEIMGIMDKLSQINTFKDFIKRCKIVGEKIKENNPKYYRVIRKAIYHYLNKVHPLQRNHNVFCKRNTFKGFL